MKPQSISQQNFLGNKKQNSMVSFSEFIPIDVVALILAKLPVKSLLRFKLVSKLWHAIISSSSFVKTHLDSYSPHFPKLLLDIHRVMHYGSASAHSLLLQPVPEPIGHGPYDDFKVVGSCDGLLLLFVGDFQKFDLVLWNPSTRILFHLPSYTDHVDYWGAWGLGYKESTEDYVVLGIFTSYTDYDVPGSTPKIREPESEVMLYSFRANSWKRIGAFRNDIPAYHDLLCKFVSGKFYFLASLHDSYDYAEEEPHVVFDIFSFDLKNETYGKIERPDYGEDALELFLDVIDECIAVVCRKESGVDVWVRTEHGGEVSWSKRVIRFFASNSGSYLSLKPLVTLPSGEMMFVYKESLGVYDPEEDVERFFETSDLDGNEQEIREADAYVESLVWPTQPEIAGGQEQ